MMNEIWIERADGYFYPNDGLSAAVRDALQMLAFDGRAEIEGGGFLIPFEKSVLLSEADAELLKFPPPNPHRLSIRATGDMGHADLRYIIEVMRPDGKFFVRARINGALLHIGSLTYRLNANQYELVRLANASNEHIATLERRQLMSYNFLNAYRIQRRATSLGANVDSYLSVDNTKIVVPEKLGVEFQATADGMFQVQPVPIADGAVDVRDFQDAFNRRRDVRDIYVGRDRTRYICSDDVQRGLRQIKSVPKFNRADKGRYSRQPKELFTDEIFSFDAEPDAQTDWLPIEGELSDRIVGIEEVNRSSYFGENIFKTDWLSTAGMDETESADDNIDSFSTGIKNVAGSKIFALKIKLNLERLDYFVGKNDLRISDVFDGALRPDKKLLAHQKSGVSWILEQWKNGCKGVLLADDMGLGKTLQTLAFLAGLKKCCRDYAKIDRPMLIVAPTALLSNWRSEYERFIQRGIFCAVIELHGRGLNFYKSGGLTPNKHRKLRLDLPRDSLALTTYETLRDYQFSFAEVEWCCIVADEIQKIKNPTAGLTTALKAMRYDYAIGLSGTPVENSWTDLWSIMDFIQPAWLGDLKSFKERYLQPLLMNFSASNIETVGNELKRNLEPLFLRRMKSDHLSGIPKKNVFKCPEEMPDYQRRRYESVLDAARRDKKIHPLEVIAALRDISLHPELIEKNLDGFYEMPADEIITQSARLIKTFAVLDEIKRRGEKALLFVVSRKMQLIIVRLIEQKFGMKILPPINGTMNGAHRQRLVDEFNGSVGFNVMVLSPLAAGVGFTITSDALLSNKKSLSDKVLFPTDDGVEDGLTIFRALTQNAKDDAND